MIAGLTLEPEIERRIWDAMQGWAEWFRQKIAAGGLPWLVAEYGEFVESVETQSCDHGSGGLRLTGQAWQECCGMSYEYINDLAVRDAIEIILAQAPPDLTRTFAQEIAKLDDRLYALYSRRPSRVGRWWYDGLPDGVVE